MSLHDDARPSRPSAVPGSVEARLEALLEVTIALDGGASLARARERFHERGGAFEDGDTYYEERIRFFLDDFLCEAGESGSGAERALLSGELGPDLVPVARACARAERGLFRVRSLGDDGRPLLEELVGGAHLRARASASPVAEGDVLDGRVLAIDGALVLAPGRVLHPAVAHEALDDVLASARARGMPRAEILDGLLRMRMRLDRFTSIRPRHVYRPEALDERDILSAGWARRR